MDITYPINNWFPYRLKINFTLHSSLPILIYGNDNATNELFGWKRNMVHLNFCTWSTKRWREVLMTTRVRNSQLIFHSLPLHENHSNQASESPLPVFCTTWLTWNNHTTLNLTQSSILMRRFRCSRGRSTFNSLLLISVSLPLFLWLPHYAAEELAK